MTQPETGVLASQTPVVMSRSEPAVRVEGLTKTYGNIRAVDDLSFDIAAGEIFALLGPNGAGKTTTVEILEGYRRPDNGLVRVLGIDPTKRASQLKPQIGVMLQEGGVYPAMSPPEAIALFSHYYPSPNDPQELLHLVGLEDMTRTPYRRLSGGQKQRLSLALALVGQPKLVFLDEPTAGLDPQARLATWDIIRDLRGQGVTILLTTHYLEEAERLADRVAIIDHGRLVALGSPGELTAGETATVRLRTGVPVAQAVLAALPSVIEIHQNGDGGYRLETRDPAALLVEVTTQLRERQVPIIELRVGQALEEIFLELTGREELE